ncbi:MAG: orotidine-5'-phosphate decarboxylase [Deltaproteobacteria bacterium]|nr:orotidine-5'-phosphate decarboxylase [Deltaproteobacteria bacterium]
MQPSERLIVALDVPERERALALAKQLAGAVGMVKVGLEAFVAHGPALVTSLVQEGHHVFLDLKLNDIPRTVAASAREAARLGAAFLTVHASGGSDMMRAAVEAAQGTRVIAVTLLTSLDDAAARAVGFAGGMRASVERLGKLATHSGAHGLVCSAHELTVLAPLGGLRVVPGIRTRAVDDDDQKRTASAAEAVALGATYIVVGRPIIEAPDPRAAAEAIVAGMMGEGGGHTQSAR